MLFRGLTLAALVVWCAAPAAAQQAVTLQFHDGQVTLSAQNAPVRAVLAEWARLGGATIVNADRVAGPPVTLELAGVPERQALDILLRSVAGYMLAPRPAGTTGVSAFNRIVILPTSSAPRNPPPAMAGGQPRPIVRPPVVMTPPEGFPMEMGGGFPEDPTIEEVAPEDVPPQIVRPGIPRIGAPPRMVMPPQPAGAEPPMAEPQIVTFDGSEPMPDEQPADGGNVAPGPGNPFGVPFGSSARPGVIAPVPQPADGVQ